MAIDTHSLLTAAAMGRVDAQTVAQGTSIDVLMDRAGQAVARLCLALRGTGSVSILCGPGNNGGDGYVAARYLHSAGWDVTVWSLGAEKLTGAAARAMEVCTAPIQPFEAYQPKTVDICIDALFGAGLARALDETVGNALLDSMRQAQTNIAVDLPSGLSGDTGAVLGSLYGPGQPRFDHCVTFGSLKYGHVLQPGHDLCGKVWVADIGLSSDAMAREASGHLVAQTILSGHPCLDPPSDGHKYKRGHVGVLAGSADKAGAAQLAAAAALRTGAGLVTLIHSRGEASSPPPLNAIMQARIEEPSALSNLCRDRKITSLVAGPGLGLDDHAQSVTDQLLEQPLPTVLDADCLTMLARRQWQGRLRGHHILTPHEGEFARLFPNISDGAKIDRFNAARSEQAAALCLKGADTLIGDRESELLVCNEGPPWLASAGSGDVLAGIIGALAGPTDPLKAAAGGALLHGIAGQMVGPGLVADDLIDALPSAINQVISERR